MRFRWFIGLGLVVAVVLFATALRDHAPTRSEYCVANVGTTRAQVDLEQGRWATLIAAIAQRRGLPPRATTIAIATAFQESKLHNITYGDRDSLGLFQQRPSQGWGTAEQVRDPKHAIGAFYDALVKVKGYETMEITDAAQRVQRSATPAAYAQHEDYARALASALRGYSPAKFTCQINPTRIGNSASVVKNVKAAFGDIDATTVGDGAAFPLTGRAADVKARGWAIAHYLVGNASHLGISTISFGDRQWDASQSDKGWRTRTPTDHNVVRVSTN
jgi:hypothetical protein